MADSKLYIFKSVDSQLVHRNGRKVVVTEQITHPTEGFDEEVLPMMRVRFGDGYVTEVWPDELEEYNGTV